MKPYYEHGGITIYHGDCREVLPTLEKVDLVLTDPPYGIGYDRNKKHKGSVAHGTVYGDDKPFDPAFLLDMKNLILWGANCYASRLPDSATWLAWHKTFTDNSSGQTADFELAWTNCVKRSRLYSHLWAGCYRATEPGQFFHPTQKPIALMTWCLQLVPQAKRIIDPFMGSGSTLVAAKNLGRFCTGIEIEERYCEIAAKRLGQEVFDLQGM
jgi:site-specific DNA-methyltransferase (adenine-specific)